MGKPSMTRKVLARNQQDAIERSGFSVNDPFTPFKNHERLNLVCTGINTRLIQGCGMWGELFEFEVVATFDKPDYFAMPGLEYIT